MNPNNPFMSTNRRPLRSRYLSTAVTSVSSVCWLAVAKTLISSGSCQRVLNGQVSMTYHIELIPSSKKEPSHCQRDDGRRGAGYTAADPSTDIVSTVFVTKLTSRRILPLQPSFTRPRHRFPYTPIIRVLAPQPSSSQTVHAR